MTDSVPTPVNQNAVPAGATGKTATVTPRNLSAEAQHVIDSLEAHLGAIVKAAQSQSPALVSAVAKFGDDALAKLESWGVELRGEVQKLETDASATQFAGALDGSGDAGSNTAAPIAPSAAAAAPYTGAGEATASAATSPAV
jgi:ABC-type uncharacterized transport system involved in gliding motility auxiliary subunit